VRQWSSIIKKEGTPGSIEIVEGEESGVWITKDSPDINREKGTKLYLKDGEFLEGRGHGELDLEKTHKGPEYAAKKRASTILDKLPKR